MGVTSNSHAANDSIYIFRAQKAVLETSVPFQYSVSFDGVGNEVFNKALPASVGNYTYSYVSGVLPSGVIFDEASQSFTGTPTVAGSFVVFLRGSKAGIEDSPVLKASFDIHAPTPTPGTATPDIADQGKTILGQSGVAIADWAPKAPIGWTGSVVEKDSGSVWNHEGTVFSANKDLSQYGLNFDTTSGKITGTPTAPFIVKDFEITVESAEGVEDSTAPFWIGVAPATPLEVAATQNDVYVFRLGNAFETQPISVTGTIGTLSFAKPAQIASGWDTSVGTWSEDGKSQTDEALNHPVSYSTTIKDEFDRTLQWSFIADFSTKLSINSGEVTAYYDTEYTEADPLATLTAGGLLGAPTWAASGLPNGLVVDETTGKITGSVSTTSLYTDGQSFDVPLNVVDSYDDSEATGNAVIIAKIAATIDVAIQVSAGDRHTCAIKPDGSAWCWGRNSSGQIGMGATTSSILTPTQVFGLSSDVAAISAGNVQTCAMKTDRSVWCWGSSYGNKPVAIAGITNARSLSAFGDRICIVKTDGTVWCWPVGGTPTLVNTISNVQSVATGVGFTCAVTADQDAWCWGAGENGKLGNGSTQNQTNPTKVVGLPTAGTGVVKIDAGWDHTCAIARDGKPYCWGLNDHGQLGTGDTTLHASAVPMQGVGRTRRISLGYRYTCMALQTGAAACVGYGEVGKLGTNNNNDAYLPVTPIGLTSNVIDVAIGGAQSIAMKSDASLAVWGRGDSGELGLGGTANPWIPQLLAF
jgi:hypothetical protein